MSLTETIGLCCLTKTTVLASWRYPNFRSKDVPYWNNWAMLSNKDNCVGICIIFQWSTILLIERVPLNNIRMKPFWSFFFSSLFFFIISVFFFFGSYVPWIITRRRMRIDAPYYWPFISLHFPAQICSTHFCSAMTSICVLLSLTGQVPHPFKTNLYPLAV